MRTFYQAVASMILATTLTGCLFSVQGNFGSTYVIGSDGSVDLSSAPGEDLENFTISLYLPPGFAGAEIHLHCRPDFDFPGFGTWASRQVLGTSSEGPGVNITFDITDIDGNCYRKPVGEDTASIAFTADNLLYLPVLSAQNMAYIVDGMLNEEQLYWIANDECLAVDDRTVEHPFGLSPVEATSNPPEEVNILTVQLPQMCCNEMFDYASQLVRTSCTSTLNFIESHS